MTIEPRWARSALPAFPPKAWDLPPLEIVVAVPPALRFLSFTANNFWQQLYAAIYMLHTARAVVVHRG